MVRAEKSPFVMAVKAAAEEARRRGDRRIGTEHLLLGLLAAADSTGAGVPRTAMLGVDLATARAMLSELDAAALRAIGLDVEGVQHAEEERRHPAVPATAQTSSTRAVINQAIKGTTRRNRSAEGPDQLLLALLARRRPDPAAELLDHLGVDRATLRARIGSGIAPTHFTRGDTSDFPGMPHRP